MRRRTLLARRPGFRTCLWGLFFSSLALLIGWELSAPLIWPFILEDALGVSVPQPWIVIKREVQTLVDESLKHSTQVSHRSARLGVDRKSAGCLAPESLSFSSSLLFLHPEERTHKNAWRVCEGGKVINKKRPGQSLLFGFFLRVWNLIGNLC